MQVPDRRIADLFAASTSKDCGCCCYATSRVCAATDVRRSDPSLAPEKLAAMKLLRSF